MKQWELIKFVSRRDDPSHSTLTKHITLRIFRTCNTDLRISIADLRAQDVVTRAQGSREF